jgi:hypothetical protein
MYGSVGGGRRRIFTLSGILMENRKKISWVIILTLKGLVVIRTVFKVFNAELGWKMLHIRVLEGEGEEEFYFGGILMRTGKDRLGDVILTLKVW